MADSLILPNSNSTNDGGLAVRGGNLKLLGNGVALVVNDLDGDRLDRLFRLLGVDKQLQEVAVIDTGIVDGDVGSLVVGRIRPYTPHIPQGLQSFPRPSASRQNPCR